MTAAPLAWAARDLARHPWLTLATGLATALLAAVLSALLLLGEGAAQGAARMLAGTPALVVRRVAPPGWTPLPEAEALRSVAGVVGITAAQPRIWGRAACRGGMVTVAGGWEAAPVPAAPGRGNPRPGEAALLGDLPGAPGDELVLEAAVPLTLRVIAQQAAPGALRFPPVVVAHPEEVRRLLGLSPGQATDLALEVFHPEESAALLPELSRAFPWPVEILRREDLLQDHRRALAAWSAGRLALWLPALAALGLLTAAQTVRLAGRREEAGLLKALGWSTGQIVGHVAAAGLLVALPAAAAGIGLGFALLAAGGSSFLAPWLPPDGPALPLFLPGAGGALAAALQAAVLVVLPGLAGALAAGLHLSGAEPVELLQWDG